MLSEPHQEECIYNEMGDIDTNYELIVLPEINGEFIVVITALGEKADISIANCYEKIATEVYYAYLQEIEISKIIWVEQIIQKEDKKAFFQVNLSWNESLQFFHSPKWEPCKEEIIEFIKTFCSKASYSKCVH
jgi:hypothetical protein